MMGIARASTARCQVFIYLFIYLFIHFFIYLIFLIMFYHIIRITVQ